MVVLGHITKTELQAKLAESDAFAGSLNRFLIVPARRSKLLPSGGSLSDFELGDFVRRFALFAVQAQTVSTIWRTTEAEEYWSEVYTRLADDDPGGLLGAVIARDAAQVLRLSVTFALLDGMNRMTVPHIRAAEAVWDYARAGAAMVFGTRTGDPVADQILTALQATPDGCLDGRSIPRPLRPPCQGRPYRPSSQRLGKAQACEQSEKRLFRETEVSCVTCEQSE